MVKEVKVLICVPDDYDGTNDELFEELLDNYGHITEDCRIIGYEFLNKKSKKKGKRVIPES